MAENKSNAENDVKNKPDGLEGLLWIMDRLREPGGCPWDRKQTLDTLKTYLIEESYEVVGAIEDNDRAGLKEELGDVLLQVVFQSRIAKENGWFDMYDVIEGVSHKLISRHPHVFGDTHLDSAEEVLDKWESFKKKEGKMLLQGVPKSLPALLMAYRVSQKVANKGFDWESLDQVMAKLDEEVAELHESVENNDGRAAEEMGDVFFTLVNLARFMKIDPEASLKQMIQRFIRRFTSMEKAAEDEGKGLDDMTLRELDKLWEQAKAENG